MSDKIRTNNGYGMHFTKIWGPIREFVEFAQSNGAWSLDVGCAYGAHTLEALRGGARVVANDIDAKHLRALSAQIPQHLRFNLRTRLGAFHKVSLPKRSIGAILAANVLLFMDGDTLERAGAKMFNVLQPGGKVFIITLSPVASIQEECRERKKSEKWPGLIKNAKPLFTSISVMPKMVHFLDVKTLSRLFTDSGFEIERAEYVMGNFKQRLTTLIARKP